tara:strand:+ start:386 stop:856 length:471 start_codon:yes stop_codon:yes gene_type:complete
MSESNGYINKSRTDSWATPQYILDEVLEDAKKNINPDIKLSKFDPCPLNDTPTFDGLDRSCIWKTQVSDDEILYINPPYSALKSTKKREGWIERIAWEAKSFNTKICVLIPARTDTQWFHDYCCRIGKIEFMRGRVKFEGAKSSAPFPTMYWKLNY